MKRVVISLTLGMVVAMCSDSILASYVQPSTPNYAWYLDSTSNAAFGGQNGVLASDATYSSDAPFAYAGNTSLATDPTNGGMTVTPSDNIAMGEAGTLSVWGKMTGYHSSDVLFDSTPNSGSRTTLGYITETSQAFSIINGTQIDYSDWSGHVAALRGDSKWHNYVFLWDNSATDKLKISVDGTQVFSSTTSVGAATSIDKLFFGMNNGSNALTTFTGRLDEYAMWNTALSADNVGWLATHSLADPMAPPSVPEPSSLVLTFVGIISLVAYAWRKRS